MEEKKSGQGDLPPVEDMPVLPDMAEGVGIGLSVGKTGKIALFHDKELKNAPDWAEYDVAARRLVFFGEDGRAQDIGMPVRPAWEEAFKKADSLFCVRISEEGKPVSGHKVPLIINN